MVKSLLFVGPRKVIFEESKEKRDLGSTEVRVKTLYSGISHGTEMRAYKGDSAAIGFNGNP